MTTVTFGVKRQLMNVIKRFKFDELETLVLPHFFETSWNRIRSQLVKNHQTFSVGNVVKLLQIEIEKQGVNENVLKERLLTLEVLDVSRHHYKKTWHCYELKGSNNHMGFRTAKDIQNKIIEYCRVYEVSVKVKIAFMDGITFAAVKQKPKNKKTMRLNSYFFALLMGQKEFFCASKCVPIYLIDAVASAMGHKSSKKLKLFGKDLTSLIKCLWQKKQGAINARNKSVTYQESKPVIRNTGIDFTQTRRRKEYMVEVFGKDPPILQSLALESTGQPWVVEDFPSQRLPTEKFPVAWEYKSFKVAIFIQRLAECDALLTPVPCYLSQWMTTGKNHLSLK